MRAPQRNALFESEAVARLQRPCRRQGIADGDQVLHVNAEFTEHALPERHQHSHPGILHRMQVTRLGEPAEQVEGLCALLEAFRSDQESGLDRLEGVPRPSRLGENPFVQRDNVQIFKETLLVVSSGRRHQVRSEIGTKRHRSAGEDTRSRPVHAEHDDERLAHPAALFPWFFG